MDRWWLFYLSDSPPCVGWAMIEVDIQPFLDNLGPMMFFVAFTLIFVGYPVAFSLGGTALIFAAIGVAFDMMNISIVKLFSMRIFGIMDNAILLAVPFFILMGATLEKARLANDLLTSIGALFGRFRGGVAFAVVFVGALLAAATGVVGASVVAMGVISMPIMLRYGYSKSLASGIICASGTLGQIIPPSVVLVVLADQLGISVGDLFRGAFFPGLMLAGLYAVYVLIIALIKPNAAPAMPRDEIESENILRRVLIALLPPLALIVLVLGSIFAGIATPTEAGALGAVGALILAILNGRLNRKTLNGALSDTVQLTTMVMFLLVGSTAFALVFRALGGDVWIQDILTQLPGATIGFLIMANLLVFVLGFFIDFFEIAFIILPLLAPAAAALGIDLVWFGVILGINLQTSFLTPPFGFSLFYLRGAVGDEVPTSAIYKGVIPFIGIQLIVLTMVCIFPEIVTALIEK